MKNIAGVLISLLILIPAVRGQTPWMRKYPDVSWKYLEKWEKTHQWLTPAREGKLYFQKHEVGKALPRLEEAVQAGADDGKLRYELGYCYYLIGKNDRAAGELRGAVEALRLSEPDHLYVFNSHYLLGEIFEAQGDEERALAEYEKALHIRPRSAVIRYRRARIFREKGLLDKAGTEIDRCLEISPEIAAANLAAGVIRLEMEDYPAARRFLEKAAALGAKKETLMPLGYLAVRRGDLETAADYYRRAVRDRPNSIEPRTALANLLYQQEEHQEALGHYQKLAELEPRRARWHHNIGVIYRESGREEEAAEAFFRARKIDSGGEGSYPTAPPELDRLSSAALEAREQKNYTKAIELYLHLLRQDPFMTDVRYNLAHTLAAAGEKNRALREYNRIVRSDPDYALAHLNLGILLFDKNRRSQEAARHFRRYLQLEPAAEQAELIRRYLRQIRGW